MLRDLKKKLYICCHAQKILLGANGECKAVKSKDGITKANALYFL